MKHWFKKPTLLESVVAILIILVLIFSTVFFMGLIELSAELLELGGTRK